MPANETETSVLSVALTAPLRRDLARVCADFGVCKACCRRRNAACAKLLAQTLARLDVDAVLYPFGNAWARRARASRAAALAIISSRPLTNSRIVEMNATTADAENLGVFRALFDASDPKSDASNRHCRARLAARRTGGFVRRRAWARTRVFGCGDDVTGRPDPRALRPEVVV